MPDTTLTIGTWAWRAGDDIAIGGLETFSVRFFSPIDFVEQAWERTVGPEGASEGGSY
jgi:hypothetical protein